MGKRKFGPGDWALIKYGDRAGDYCKVAMLNKEGGYMVIPYDSSNEPGDMMTLNARAMDRIPPLELDEEQLKKLLTARELYRNIKDKVFPPFNIRAKKKYDLSAADIRDALLYIGGRGNCLDDFKEWFWLIINVFYDDLGIKERYREDFFSDCPENDDEMFCVAYGLVEKLYWRLEERFSQKEYMEHFIIRFAEPFDWEAGGRKKPVEVTGYKIVSDDIISRVNVYEYNRTRPKERRVYSSSEKKHIISGYEDASSLRNASPEAIDRYREFVEDLYNEGDAQAMKVLAWGYFEGNAAFEKNMEQARHYMEEFFAKTGDPYAANVLGYICYYGFTNDNVPEYKEAFSYYTYGAMAGIDECAYMAADMLLAGRGTVKNVDMGLNMIVDGYRDTMNIFSSGNFDCKLPEFAYRMGNACRDNLIYGMNLRDAYKFYLEAAFAAAERKKCSKYPDNSPIEGKIDAAIQQIMRKLPISPSQDTIKTDFPLYLSQLFEDRYPLKITLNVDKSRRSGTLTVSRFRFGSELKEKSPEGENGLLAGLSDVPSILVAYPELSWAELVTEITYRLEGITVAQKTEKSPFFMADGFRKNEATNAVEFFSNGTVVAAIDCEWYVIKVDKSRKKKKTQGDK